MDFNAIISNLTTNNKALETLPEKVMDLGMRVIFAILFFVIGIQVIKLIQRIVTKSMKRANAELGAIQFVDSFIKASLYIVLVFIIASDFGLDAASVAAILGSAGVAIGLAIQGSLSNLAGGVLILTLKPFKVGDYIIENASKMEGTVSQIQIFYTKLLTPDNKVIILPNGSLANNSLVNLTSMKCRRLDLSIGVSYDANLKLAKQAIQDFLDKDEKVMKDREKIVVVEELADSCVKLLVRCWFDNNDYWDGKWRITEGCKDVLDAANIEIPYPHLDVNVKSYSN